MSLNDQPWDIDKVTKQDLIRELSDEALDYYATIRLGEGWPSYERATICKFVRLGAVIFLGSAIDFGKRPPMHRGREGKRDSLYHRDIAHFVLSQEPIEKVQTIANTLASDERVLGYQFMVDAGYAGIGVDNDKTVKSLLFSGDSFDFGRADSNGRQRTLAIARSAISASTEVFSRD